MPTPGNRHGLPNGCGNLTLLNCFSRLLIRSPGTVFLGDNPINASSAPVGRRISLPAPPFNARDHSLPGDGFRMVVILAVTLASPLKT